MINLLKHCALTYFAKNTYWENTPEIVWSDDNKASTDKVRGYHVTLVLRDGDEERPFYLAPNKLDPNGLIRAEKWIESEKVEEFIYVSMLSKARISVSYYQNGFVDSAENCSVLRLIQMALLKKIGLMYINILHAKNASRRMSKRLRVANSLTKFQLYELIMPCDNRRRTGVFSVDDLIRASWGISYVPIGSYEVYEIYKFEICDMLNACVDLGEIQREGDSYRLKGKGLSFFTETREAIKAEEHKRYMQKKQTHIQKWMKRYTGILAIGTLAMGVGEFKCELSEAEWVKSIAPKAVELVAKQCKP